MAKPTSFSSIILNLTSLGITGGQLYLNGQSSLVYNTGAQNISGIKTYYDRPNFLSGLNLSGKTLTATGSNLYLNGTGILDSTIVRTTGDQIISGVKTFSYVIAENIANNSEQQIVNLTDGFLKRIGGALSIDWKNQIAYDQGEDISINWNNKKLYSTGYQRVDWSSGILYSLYAGGEMATVNWMSGLLYSSANGASTPKDPRNI